jgi:hypothetical protein
MIEFLTIMKGSKIQKAKESENDIVIQLRNLFRVPGL